LDAIFKNHISSAMVQFIYIYDCTIAQVIFRGVFIEFKPIFDLEKSKTMSAIKYPTQPREVVCFSAIQVKTVKDGIVNLFFGL